MKHLFATTALVLGLSAAAADIKTVAPTTASFSVATINSALPELEANAMPNARDLTIHDSDWRQFEAISRNYEAEMQEELSSIRQIYQDKSRVSGGYRTFSDVYIRKKIEHPLSTSLAWSELVSSTGTQPTSIAKVGIREKGMVKDGFSFRVGQFTLFGIRHGDNVEVLCFDFTRTPGLSEAEAQSFAALMDKCRLVVVHWPSASVIKDKRGLVNFLLQKREKKG